MDHDEIHILFNTAHALYAVADAVSKLERTAEVRRVHGEIANLCLKSAARLDEVATKVYADARKGDG